MVLLQRLRESRQIHAERGEPLHVRDHLELLYIAANRIHPGKTRRVFEQRRNDPVLRCARSEEHTSELQSLMRISYAVFCLKKKNSKNLHKPHLHDSIEH